MIHPVLHSKLPVTPPDTAVNIQPNSTAKGRKRCSTHTLVALVDILFCALYSFFTLFKNRNKYICMGRHFTLRICLKEFLPVFCNKQEFWHSLTNIWAMWNPQWCISDILDLKIIHFNAEVFFFAFLSNNKNTY